MRRVRSGSGGSEALGDVVIVVGVDGEAASW